MKREVARARFGPGTASGAGAAPARDGGVAARPWAARARRAPLGRLAAAAPLLAVAAVLLLPAAPAEAQTTFVSNTGQTYDENEKDFVGPFRQEQYSLAQGFTTGSQAGGYLLGSVLLNLFGIGNLDVPKVSIYSVNSQGDPVSSVYVLTNPDRFVDSSFNTFTAPANATLAANGRYAVVVEATEGAFSVGVTGRFSEDSGNATGWSIGNGVLYRFSDSGRWIRLPRVLRIAVRELAPNVSFGAAIYTALEGGSAERVTVTLLPAQSSSVTVPLTATPLGGAAEADYTGIPASLTFAANETSKTFTVTAVDDADVDPGESVRIAFGALPQGIAAGSPATVNLVDDDSTSQGSIFDTVLTVGDWTSGQGCSSSSNFKCSERMGTHTFTSTDSQGVARTFTIEGLSAGTVSGGENQGNRSLSFWVSADNPFRDYENHRLMLVLDGRRFPFWAVNHTLNSRRVKTWEDTGLTTWGHGRTVRVEIFDLPNAVPSPAPDPGLPSFKVLDAEANEADGYMSFTVKLRRPTVDGSPLLGGAEVDYTTVDGTAVAGEDYTHTAGTLTFGEEQEKATVRVALIDDTVEDDGETFTLRLSNPKGATIIQGEATGTIRNTEGLTASFENVPESHEGSGEFTLRLAFSEALAAGGAGRKIGQALVLNGATRGTVLRVDGRRDLYEFKVRPTGDGAVTVSLLATAEACDADDGICTAEGDKLSGSVSVEIAGPDTGREPQTSLTAEFEDVPESHDGSSAFTFRVAFSEAVSTGFRAMRDDVFTVSGGSVTGAKRVDGQSDLWEIRVEPSGSGAVTVSLPATTGDCTATGAVCTSGGLKLSASVSAEIAGPDTGQEPQTSLTASFENVPESHDGSSAFTFRVAFSEAVSTGFRAMRDDVFTVSGGSVTGAKRVDGQSDLWEIRVEPSGSGTVTVSLPATTGDCTATGAVCTSGGLKLSASVSAEIAGPTPLTASFSEAPSEHDGSGAFEVKVLFSEALAAGGSGRKIAQALALTGATRGDVRRVDGRYDLYRFQLRPSGNDAVTVSLASTGACGGAAAVCTSDGRALSNVPEATVAGPPSLSVADVEVDEGPNAALAFTVALSRTASGTVTVDYATSDVTATAGDDYTAASGTLTFAAGETSKTVSVSVLDDSHDDDGETLTLTLSNASGAYLADATATGTIHNSDPLPRALMARFGRAAAVHVVEHVEERLQAPREPGFRGRFAGRELRRGMERDVALGLLQGLGSLTGHPAGPAGGALPGVPGAPVGSPGLAAAGSSGMAEGPLGAVPGSGLGGPGMAPAGSMAAGSMAADPGLGRGSLGRALSMGLGGGDPLTGSAFALNRETHGGVLSFWSRGAQSHFSGREGELSLGGDVRTTMFGADYARGPLVAGLSLSHSRGLGEYAGASRGQVASAVTGLYPWLGYKATERVTVWGTAGYGAGAMLVTLDGGPALETGLSMAMAAAGTRGELVAGGAGGFELAFKADALWVGTASDGVDGPTGRLAATEAAVTRVRTGLEGSRAYTLGGRLSLKPMVEVGLRQDGGDAETGAGIDVGGGFVASDAATGLAVDVRVRTLVLHQAEGFRERGVALSVSYTPTPSTPLGFAARVAPSWGGRATSGAEALWGRETMAGMANGGVAAAGDRLDAEVGYGLPVGSRLVGTPRVGFGTSEHGRDYRLGYGMTMLQTGSTQLRLGVDAQRRESPLRDGADHAVLGRATVGW